MIIPHITHDGLTHYNVNTDTSALPATLLLGPAQKKLVSQVDTAAGNARQAFVSAGYLIEEEYRLAKTEAVAWREAGEPAEVPVSVQDAADAMGITPSQAAQEIVDTATAWESALADIRRQRLAGKAAVRAAETVDAAEQAAHDAIVALNGYRPTITQ